MIPEPRVSPWRKVAIAPLVAAALLKSVPAPVVAQSEREVHTAASTGLFTLARLHSATLYLVDAGQSTAATTDAILELLDAEDVVIRRTSGELRPGRPLRLTLNGPETGTMAFRARVMLRTSEANIASAPMLTLEVFNQQTFDSFTNATCRLKFDPEGTGGKVLGDCGGCEISVNFDH